MERSLESEWPWRALRMALACRPYPAGRIPHSAPGVQYASCASTEVWRDTGLRISLSRRGNPDDHAKAERFFTTLNYEEGYLWEYETLTEARPRMGFFLEAVYNCKRLHSALGSRPPVEFEQALPTLTSA